MIPRSLSGKAWDLFVDGDNILYFKKVLYFKGVLTMSTHLTGLLLGCSEIMHSTWQSELGGHHLVMVTGPSLEASTPEGLLCHHHCPFVVMEVIPRGLLVLPRRTPSTISPPEVS